MLTLKTINSPSPGVLRILSRRIKDERIKERIKKGQVKAVGLVQGQLAEVISASDLAEKASNVEVAEIAGICPQHIAMIGIFGDTAEVSEAMQAIANLTD
ncbi:MAG: BMC domain-containing protein [Firmicutes bacterium]|jgi:hypothetical protein|nr:BMC domain-containing protein [Bacillota bacterium]HOB21517.1 BMC domain-containing protein [Bacillota bacterium]HQD40323.1 BMC domain-containing protein [Bacillota bacterium]